MRHLYDESRRDAAERLGFEMSDFDTFWRDGYARCPVRTNHTFLADFRVDPAAHALKTESGKIVLGSETLARLGYADCPSHPTWVEPAEWLGNGSDGIDLHMISHQPAGRLHSQIETGIASTSTKRNGREQARLHPEDAATRGISDGQTIRIWNSRGACLATADVTDSVRRGVLVLPTGAWFTPRDESGLEVAGNPNVLTLDIGTSQFGQGCAAHTCLVRAEPHVNDQRDAFEEYQDKLAALVTA